jgi:polysaccharide biosynthesis/export protein
VIHLKTARWVLIGLLLVGGATDSLAASVTLTWDAEAGLRYMVFYGTEPGKYTRTVDAKDQHSIVITGLADRQLYYFAVRSYDERGQMSDFSSEVRKLAVESPASDQKEPSVDAGAAVAVRSGAAPKAARVVAPEPDAASAPAGYVIGPNDVLSVTFWHDKEMNADAVVVRPDGNITLPLLNDIQAAGLTPAQLRDRILTEAQRYIEDPSPTVAVKEIKSRNVFITGQVDKPGPYPLAGPMTVLQLIAMAGGLKEFADGKNIVVMRSENGRQVAYQVDYKELLKRKNLHQNIDLKPGDTVVVP